MYDMQLLIFASQQSFHNFFAVPYFYNKTVSLWTNARQLYPNGFDLYETLDCLG